MRDILQGACLTVCTHVPVNFMCLREGVRQCACAAGHSAECTGGAQASMWGCAAVSCGECSYECVHGMCTEDVCKPGGSTFGSGCMGN